MSTKVGVVGSGYDGTTLGACLADLGDDVIAADADHEVVVALDDGRPVVKKAGLNELIADGVAAGHLRAMTEYDAIKDAAVVFLALPTPSRKDGSADTSLR